ncbi:uncharacterized protein [Dermacentor albipictus]|uniref:uncharacterized protein isoform X3 n=1 Tax=Dermacentor albipictus TaxID=60249 RepID=UPI0038FCBD6F
MLLANVGSEEGGITNSVQGWKVIPKVNHRRAHRDDNDELQDEKTEAKDVDRGFRRRWQHLERGDFDDEDERVSEAHWAIVAAVVSSTSIVIAFFVFVALAFHARADVVAVRHRASRPQEFASPVLAQLIAYGENVTVPAAPAKSYRPQMSSKLMAMGDADVQCSAEAVTTRAAAVAAIITGSSAQAASSNVSRKDCNPPECG